MTITKIVITDIIDTADDFVEVDMNDKAFWKLFHILKNLFQTELSVHELSIFTCFF